MKSTHSYQCRRPLIIGEVLWDQFPGGSRVLGGAPFNVAWNLAGFGERPLLLSAVGDDNDGRRILECMRDWGMSTAGVEVHFRHATGLVRISDAEENPRYEILPNRAWDFLHRPGIPVGQDQFGLLYHGSLACRSAKNRELIMSLRRETGLPVFLDINIRPPWFDAEWTDTMLPMVTWLKLNRDELAQVSGNPRTEPQDIVEISSMLMDRYEIGHILVTDGANGAHYLSRSGEHHFQAAPAVKGFVDSVGAGDSFASVCIRGALYGWEPGIMLARAVDFSARVCGLKGAITDNRAFYHPSFT